MRIVKQGYKILSITDNVVKLIEKAARLCYKSEDKIKDGSDLVLLDKILKSEHFSVIEHGLITVKFITNRAISHELVRNRLASFSQESTRYCNYKDKDMEYILPIAFEKLSLDSSEVKLWKKFCIDNEKLYREYIENGHSPQIAMDILPNCLKTEIIVSANLREWRHIAELRLANSAHPQIRSLVNPLIKELSGKIPLIFDEFVKKR